MSGVLKSPTIIVLLLISPFILGLSVGMEVFDEILSINVPWSQEFSGVLRFCT